MTFHLFLVQLSEPTRYSNVFDYVIKNFCTKDSEDDYTIVLLVTDGGVTDFEETKEVLVRNSHMPLSVVLVSRTITESKFLFFKLCQTIQTVVHTFIL